MDFSKLLKFKDLIGTVAPTIASALGAPGLAITAVTAISKALFGHETASVNDIEKKLATGSSDILLKLKTAEQDFIVAMERLSVDVFALEIKDTDSARKMKIATGGHAQEILAGIFIGGYFFIFYSLASGDIAVTPENSAMIMILIGIMSAAVSQIINFYFGSSKGSKEKTAALSAAVNK